MLASMNLFANKHPQNLTLIFRSDDNGKSRHYISELMQCFWGKLFLHKGELYMLACPTEYGDLLIGKSTDGGRTFFSPVTLLRGSNGKNGNSGIQKIRRTSSTTTDAFTNPSNGAHGRTRNTATQPW